MTIDEELTLLDSQLRRLKIEYEIYFSNPTKRPPTDIEWKVLSLLRKFSDGGRMSFSQRFRYNEIAQRYAIYSDLWRKKNRIREEGYRRPQDALLSVQGVRVEEHEPEHKVYGVGHAAAAGAAAAGATTTPAAAIPAAASPAERKPFSMQCADARAERDQVQKLYQALTDAKKKIGRSRLRQSRQLYLVRAEENRTDPQTVRLRSSRIHGRNAERSSQAEGQSENLVVSRRSSVVSTSTLFAASMTRWSARAPLS